MIVAVTGISADQRARLDEWLGRWEVLRTARPTWSTTTPGQGSSSPATFPANSWKAPPPKPTRTSTGRRANCWPDCRRQPGSRAPTPGRRSPPSPGGSPKPAGNWVIDNGRVGVIDFGRGLDRSWVSDLVRLQNQQFTGHPERNRAFMTGLGRTVGNDDAELLVIESMRQALGTVIWAHTIGDRDFEEHGRTMITRLL
jgi:hypothetical protein